jgi:Thaumatin family/Malectin domain
MKVANRTTLRGANVSVALGLLLLTLTAAAQTRQFTIKNSCSETVWLAGAGTPTPVFNGSPGGLQLGPGAVVTTTVPVPWVAGRFWGRRNCTFDSSGHGTCATGDCGGLLQCTHSGAGTTSLAEFTLTGSSTGSDNYDISLVDAFDFPISIQLDDPNPNHCVNPACQADLRTFCPPDMQIKDAAGNIVRCQSLCGKFGTPNYCCAGPYGVPGACNNVSWNLNFRETMVKSHCPSVYGFAYDDASSDFNCHVPAQPGYIITFCPSSSVPNADPNTTPTFTITATDNNQTVVPGASVTYHLNITASSTFNGTIALGAAHLPQSCTWDTAGKVSCSATAARAIFDRPSVTLTPGTTVPVSMTIQTAASPPPILGTAAIEVLGQSGAIENVWEGSLTVADPSAPDYTLQVSPASSQTVAPGSSVVYDLTLTPKNGFAGTVTLASFGAPPGSSTFSPGQLSFSGPSQTRTATLTLNTSTTAKAKTYFPLITTFSANRLHDFQGLLTLSNSVGPDFTISATPGSQTVAPWGTTSYTVTVTPQNGFAGTVALSSGGLPSGASASFNPASISGSGSSTLTVTTASSTPSGSYTLSCTGTSGSLAHSASVVLTVSAIAPQPPSNLMATAASSSATNLTWTASPTSGVTHDIFRSATSGFTPSSSNQIASGGTSTSFADSGLTCNTTYFYLVEAANAGGTSAASNQASATTQACVPVILQINAGGPAVTPFAADKDFAGGTTIHHANTIDLSAVTNPAPMAVYQTARVGNFTYTLPGFTAGASHTVRLQFAETYFGTAGSRKFNVKINGTQVLSAFDIFAAAGAKNKAIIEQFTVNANASGQYIVQFTSVVNQSLLSAIEVQ